MKKVITILVMALVGYIGPVSAGSGHDHGHKHNLDHAHKPATADTVSTKAMKKVEQLVKSKKIDASWSGATPVSVEQKKVAKGTEWVAVFKNTQTSDQTKQTLYLFFSLDGHYIAANYTGQ